MTILIRILIATVVMPCALFTGGCATSTPYMPDEMLSVPRVQGGEVLVFGGYAETVDSMMVYTTLKKKGMIPMLDSSIIKDELRDAKRRKASDAYLTQLRVALRTGFLPGNKYSEGVVLWLPNNPRPAVEVRLEKEDYEMAYGGRGYNDKVFTQKATTSAFTLSCKYRGQLLWSRRVSPNSPRQIKYSSIDTLHYEAFNEAENIINKMAPNVT